MGGCGDRRFSSGTNLARLSSDDWRCLGVDHFGLRALSGIQIRLRRVQRQVVRRAEGPARRIVRYAADPHSINLSKFFLSARALDDRGIQMRKVTQTLVCALAENL